VESALPVWANTTIQPQRYKSAPRQRVIDEDETFLPGLGVAKVHFLAK
jgi:hypothetical protein